MMFQSDRRTTLAALAAATFAAVSGIPGPVRGAGLPVRMSRSSPGTAGTVWEGLIDRFPDFKEALEVTWVDGDPGQLQAFIVSGAIHAGPYGPIGVAEAAQRGIDLVMFGPKLNNHGSWLVRADSPYQTPRDLKGKRIATQAPTSDTYRQARMAAALNGLDLRKDFEVVYGPPTSNIALFNRGDVDGLIMLEPTSTRLIARGAREIARVADMWKTATGDQAPLMLVGTSGLRSWVDANRKTAHLVGELSSKLNHLITTRPEILTEPAVRESLRIPETETAAIALLSKRLATVYPAEWDQAVFDGIERQYQVALDLGLIERKPDRRTYEPIQS